MIYHGRTFLSKVSLQAICQVINKYTFVTSLYLVIISVELHLNVKQQDTMADVMMEEFGKRLVMVPIEQEWLQLDKLLSPVEIQNFIEGEPFSSVFFNFEQFKSGEK